MKVEELLDLIACPKCHSKLSAVHASDAPHAPHAPHAPNQTSGFLCDSCKLLFAYEDGLPNMLISEAREWPLPAAAPRSS